MVSVRVIAASIAFCSGGLDVSYRLALAEWGFCVKAIMASKVDGIVGPHCSNIL